MRLAGAVVALAALALFGSAPGGARIAPAVNWTRTVVATPEGGFRMGNPNAKVKLVEYGSLACPHCRHFEQTGYKPLVQTYVRTGRVSYEFRNLLLNAPDLAVSLLTPSERNAAAARSRMDGYLDQIAACQRRSRWRSVALRLCFAAGLPLSRAQSIPSHRIMPLYRYITCCVEYGKSYCAPSLR